MTTKESVYGTTQILTAKQPLLVRTSTVVCVYICIFTQMLDSSIVNLALVIISGDLGLDVYHSVWIVTSFLVGLSGSFALFNLVAKTFDESQLFLNAIFWFVIASLACAVAQETNILLLARFFQGLTSGAILLLSQSILIRAFSDKHRALAIAIWGSALSLAPIFGPMIGGYITLNWGWRYLFYINIPLLGCSYLLLSQVLQPNLKVKTGVSVKAWFTVISTLVFMISFQVTIEQGERLHWFHSETIIILSSLAMISLFVFFHLNQGVGEVLNLKVLKQKKFTTSIVILTIGHALNFSSLIVLPFWLQFSYQMPLLWTGVVVAINGIVTFIMTPIFAKVKSAFNLRLLASASLVLLALAFAMMSNFNPGTSLLFIISSRVVLGIGLSIFYTPLTVISYEGMEKTEITNANSIALIIRMVFTSMVVALAYIFLKNLNIEYYAEIANSQLMPWIQQSMSLHFLRTLSQTAALQTICTVASVTCIVVFFVSLSLFSKEGSEKETQIEAENKPV